MESLNPGVGGSYRYNPELDRVDLIDFTFDPYSPPHPYAEDPAVSGVERLAPEPEPPAADPPAAEPPAADPPAAEPDPVDPFNPLA